MHEWIVRIVVLMRLDKINAVGGTVVLICGVLLYLSPDNLTANSIIIQSAGIIGASYLASVPVSYTHLTLPTTPYV